MSGHSKWSTIKHKKAATDAKRGKIFTRLIREIQIAARDGGPDMEANSRLRSAVAAAKAQSMPGENIRRAIQRGSGQLEGGTFSEIVFEGYAPGGVAVLVETVTDNRNRTVAELRHIFAKNGGNLGENGCVSWMFHTQSLVVVPKEAASEDELMELALMAGAEDLTESGGGWSIHSPPDAHAGLLSALREAGVHPMSAEILRAAENTVRVSGREKLRVIRMMEKLGDQDDVQNIYTNLHVDESAIAAQSA